MFLSLQDVHVHACISARYTCGFTIYSFPSQIKGTVSGGDEWLVCLEASDKPEHILSERLTDSNTAAK